MPEEWPIAASAADGNAPARLAGRGRLSTVRRDFFLDPAKRLTEQERALMTAMLHCLVGDVADAIRAALPNGRAAANDEGEVGLIEAMTSSGLLDEPGLMALLHFLDEAGGLTDDLVLAAAHEGEVAFVAEVIARRAGIRSESAMDELLSGESDHVMALLRMANVSRELGAGLLAGIGDLLGI